MNPCHRLFILALALGIGCVAEIPASPPGDPPPAARPPAADARPPDPAPAPRTQPAGWDQQLRLREATDLDPDPRIVEIRLEARLAPVELLPGTTTMAWTYDGSVPGPLIRVKRGDRLLVHFSNALPQETTVHWHGLRIPVAMDGVPGHSQPAVPPGGRFDYEFVVPDAGMFWYHPHFRSADQVGDGLYGAIIVEDEAEPAGLGDELVLVLSDADIEPDGHLGVHDKGGDVATLFGREGNVLLVNGRVRPTIKARPGLAQRWRLVNSAKSRYYQVGIEGQRFLRIGGDGGLLSSPQELERIVLTPGERADVVLVPTGAPGTEIPVRWIPYDRGYGSTFRRPEEVIATLALEGPAAEPRPIPATARQIVPIPTAGATAVDIKLTQDKVNGKFALGINNTPFNEHVPARVGETQVWTIVNTIDFAHPFHLHGFFFQVLDASGAPKQPLEWKDTADVPTKGQVKIVVRYEDRPGMWMFHCHILDHAEAGMMGMLMLER
jgi:FtsP/CotA-like multicopper oxidase with cupredoxin domain